MGDHLPWCTHDLEGVPMRTNPRSALVGLLFSALFVISACGSGATHGGTVAADADPGTTEAVSTTMLSVSTTTVSSDDARSGFVSDVSAAAPILEGLTEADLGCVADRLLVEVDPAEVVALTRNGPRPDQASLAVAALRDCDLVVAVVGLGIGQSLAADPDAPPIEPACMLKGVTADDLVPYLEERFETGVVNLDDDEAMDLLLDTPVMANMIRCSAEAMLDISTDAPAVCAGLAEHLGLMMATLMEMEPEPGAEPDPFALVGVFRVTDEVFAWLVDEVPPDLRDDAKLVREATGRIGTLMAEALRDLTEASEDDLAADSAANEARMAAFLGMMARIAADLEADMDEVDAAAARLRNWTIATCGDSSSMLFELLTGMWG